MRFSLMLLACLCQVVLNGSDWRLVWSDEFEVDGRPDPEKWGYEEGFVRNEELQYYTVDRAENARVEGGHLVIEGRRERFPNPNFRADAVRKRWQQRREAAEYTSASLTTRGKASWTYGRVEVRAKLPGGRGTWPAIWMLGTNIGSVGWPACGEIDIMEHVGSEPDGVHANVHTRDYNHVRGTGRGRRLAFPGVEEGFHVYRVDWAREKLEFFVDGKLFFTCANNGEGVGAWPFDAPEYLILNLAIGGSWGGEKGVEPEAFPRKFMIDYVRVYQRRG